MIRDIRFALRSLTRSPGFTVVAVVTLALGIGANGVMFSALKSILLAPFSFPEEHRLVEVWEQERARGRMRESLSPAGYLELRNETSLFESVAANRRYHFNLTGPGRPERLKGVLATADLFPALGTAPLLGRVYTRADETAAAKVAVISEGVWQRSFGGDSSVVGRRVMLEGEPVEIVGVMPDAFNYPLGSDVWAPLVFPAEERLLWNSRYLNAFGRLRRGVSIERASAMMETIGARIDREYHGGASGFAFTARPIFERYQEDAAAPLAVLSSAVFCVLLIACTNIANLLLSRSARRGRELAMRAALGADRSRLVRQLLTESIVLALLGGGAGTLVAMWGVEILKTSVPQEMWRGVAGWSQLGLDPGVLAFTFGLAAFTGVLFGLAPAVRASRIDLVGTLKEAGRGAAGGRRGRFRRALVVAEVALALTLLVAAGLLLRSYAELQGVDAGFDERGVLALWVSLPEATYPDDASVDRFFRAAERAVGSIGGVTSVSSDASPPFSGNVSKVTIDIASQPIADPEERPMVEIHPVGPGYFRTLGARMLQGRDIDERDRSGAGRVAVVSREVAERYWPGRSPIGERLTVGGDTVETTVVGVAPDLRTDDIGEPAPAEIFLSHAQHPRRTASILVRTRFDDAYELREDIVAQIASIDRDQAVFDVQSLEDRVDDSLRGRRVTMIFLAVFSGIALLLAVVGIYSVVSSSVAERTHEIGLRMALGANRRSVLRMVLRDGIAPVLLGLAVGIPAAIGLSGALESLLYGVGPRDPVTIGAVALLLPLVALVASYLPARRAMRVEPMEALRYE